MNKTVNAIILFVLTILLLAGCGQAMKGSSPTDDPTSIGDVSENDPNITQPGAADEAPDVPGTNDSTDQTGVPDASSSNDQSDDNPTDKGDTENIEKVLPEADSIAVLVNKQLALPENYEPKDLVYPDVAFIFAEKIEKRMMRKEAAGALEKMFKGAKEDGIYLAGVSAYRSHATQAALFKRYVEKDGEEKARMYSAFPGTSEHETGLAIDVSASDGKCAAEDCFGDTQEAKWLAEHAAEYGFIIRYPKGKEAITGYQYEPWHLRYVGTTISKEIFDNDLTLEQYYDAIPVSN